MNTRRSVGALTAKVAESVAGMKVTQSFAAEDADQAEFTESNRQEHGHQRARRPSWSSFIGPMAQIIQSFGIFAVFYFGAMIIYGGAARDRHTGRLLHLAQQPLQAGPADHAVLSAVPVGDGRARQGTADNRRPHRPHRVTQRRSSSQRWRAPWTSTTSPSGTRRATPTPSPTSTCTSSRRR